MKGFIFDLDGVICSTDEYHYEAWKVLAKKLGVSFSRMDNNRQRGVSRMESLEVLLEKSEKLFTEDEKVTLADYKNKIYQSLLNNMGEKDLSYEVKDTLDRLREKGYKLAIGSSSRNAKIILEKIGLDNYFDAVSDGNNITKSKPDPEVFIKAAEYMNIPCEQCYVVEDAKSGVEAAIAGGFKTIAVGDAIKYKIAEYNLNSFQELLKIV
ncbi:beta-phosphoglucomutase [Lachnoclostridium phytofermentans]|uniref:Beta-phosphoglucomutase n=1 Tax=Lachnoclostridium phytofermentans (strain ATCC 700394 / DSM 18823 / ISDg) TaxID=357809 RepID=A9KM58_LACP7|nr:beta-phosphoglucomutase [Lachnoclostridium phytofermentans]ABX41401.1 beta-phosphoglucomutase [Lachnoclostridium phytofermentans ISDg]